MIRITDSVDANELKKNTFASYRSEVEVLITKENTTQKVRAFFDIGAASSTSLGHLLAPGELQNNLLPVEWMQQSESFTTNKFAMLKFMMPEFTESSVVAFPIHVNANVKHNTQTCDIVLGLDAIIELGMMIDGKNKTITWEDTSIPLKHVPIASPLSNEIAIGKPLFGAMQPVEKGFMNNELNNVMQSKVHNRTKNIARKSSNFINQILYEFRFTQCLAQCM